MASNRANRVADRIREIVAELLETRVKDPRLGFITLTEVRVTGDLQQASIFYTVLGDEAAQESTAAALTSAASMIRREVGHQLQLRIVPTIEFIRDGLQESASALNDVLAQARARDEELQALRATAKPVAENPYKK
jgi:ribosome-binding factor A